MSANFGQDIQTALVIIPPKEFWEQIQAIRKGHDAAYHRWMPHINIMFPFVPETNFMKTKELIENELKKNNVKQFDIELKNLSYFNHGRALILWTGPGPQNDESLQRIHKSATSVLPHLPVRNKYVPHLTLGNSWLNEKSIIESQKTFQQKWKPIKFTVDALHLISRKGRNDPFQIITSIKL